MTSQGNPGAPLDERPSPGDGSRTGAVRELWDSRRMLETSARLLRLLSLLQARREWSGRELAERLEVTDRTVRRDVERLRALGYPVHASAGTGGGYRRGAGAALPPLLLDDEEAVAVAIALRTAAGGSVTDIEETALRALAKLEQVLPSRLRHRVAGLQAVTVTVRRRGPTVDPATLTLLATACRDHERVRFDYRTHDGVDSRRTVEPHRLVTTGSRWYLVGYDTGRGDWRTFRVDRLLPRPPTGPRFVPRTPPDADMAAYTTRGIATAVYRYRARVVLAAPASAVAEQVPPTSGLVEAVDDDSCVLHTGADSLDALAVHLALLGVDFVVEEPRELVDRLQEVGARLTNAALESIPRSVGASPTSSPST